MNQYIMIMRTISFQTQEDAEQDKRVRNRTQLRRRARIIRSIKIIIRRISGRIKRKDEEE